MVLTNVGWKKESTSAQPNRHGGSEEHSKAMFKDPHAERHAAWCGAGIMTQEWIAEVQKGLSF